MTFHLISKGQIQNDTFVLENIGLENGNIKSLMVNWILNGNSTTRDSTFRN
jgi:hypothetical protein